MASGAVAGVGTIFYRWNGADWDAIAEVRAIIGPAMTKDTIDVTSLNTTDGTREFTTGFMNGGTLSLAMSFTRDTYELFKEDFEDTALQYYGIMLPDADDTFLDFEGLVTKLPLGIAADDKIDVNVEIQVSGRVGRTLRGSIIGAATVSGTLTGLGEAESSSSEAIPLTMKLALVENDNGLHCISVDTGEVIWFFDDYLGHTPAVDQANGIIYFQSYQKITKLNAHTGEIIKQVTLSDSGGGSYNVTSSNVILANDEHGYHVIFWSMKTAAYNGHVRCYDGELNLEWEKKGLNTSVKTCIAYHDGVVFVPTGETFGYSYIEAWYDGKNEDCKVIAYNISDGSIKWTYEKDPYRMFFLGGHGFMQVIVCNGYVIAETNGGGYPEASSAVGSSSEESGEYYEIHVLNEETGELEAFYEDPTFFATSCGQPALSYGRLYTGDLTSDTCVVTQLGTGLKTDYAPYGTHQTNTFVAPANALQSINSTITEVGRIPNGHQGVVIYDGKGYVIRDNYHCIKFDIETLDAELEINCGSAYDSSPMVIEKIDGTPILLIKENSNSRVTAWDIDDGSNLWNSAAGMPGNLFFGFAYFEAPFELDEEMVEDSSGGGETNAAIINNIFTVMNSFLDTSTSLTQITTFEYEQAMFDIIEGNFDALNAELSEPVTYAEFDSSMTPSQFNANFNTYVRGFISQFENVTP